ncbi:trehalose-6-phosphate synthase [Erythrobacteraceae bacterium CFH 75059]|uniref:alpha,alpha-trehalose-phosphate synthase (UDP-forming) n=1 Tax=Qipengyuania thermophila TaxID=2509361 RepID=UPI001020312B|nr:trehalose-6-phosphate synthase [Qipengyuania thermophila]TCD02239.1 trehalose-6-phosphate synthase [Erythrobacteraceae bacterium CFH 75059]
MSRLVVLSNRVASATSAGVPGAQGGLAGALHAALRARRGLWIGWSGEAVEEPDAQPHVTTADEVTTATLDLSHADVDAYYNGYANATLWPLFHYRVDLAQFQRETAKGYERVNALFARAAAPLIRSDDTVWVHDYHFIPLGEQLRAQGLRNRMGFFLHIPCPPADLLASLPYHERLFRTLLAYDVVGFQSDMWRDNFLDYCAEELKAAVDRDTGRVTLDDRSMLVRTYPVGIDYDHFTQQGQTGEARQAEQRMLSSTRHRVAMIGVDRLDYSKGLPERMDGVARLFEDDPSAARQLVYIQIAPPSRQDVESYQTIRETLERKTGRINGEFSEIDLVPIRYVNRGHSAAELYGFYRAAKIGLVTPLRDGMNLVAKEYVAAQDPADPGVLILSRFAGAAQQLTDAMLVNPHSPDELAHAINRARVMPLEERRARWEAMHASVRAQTVQRWAADFCTDLEGDGSP